MKEGFIMLDYTVRPPMARSKGKRKNAFIRALISIFPAKGDAAAEIIRKIIFLGAVVALVFTGGALLSDIRGELVQQYVISDRLDKIKKKLQEQLIGSISQENYNSDDEIYEAIERSVLQESREVYITADEKQYLVKSVYNSIKGLDVLQDIVDNPEITEIMVNGPGHIFIEKDGRITEYPGHFSSVQKLEDVIQQIVAKVNRMVNEANPIVDVRLMDGSRVNIVLPPVSLNGPVVTIRKFPEVPMTMDKLIAIGSVSTEAASFLKTLVVARYNIFISGGTGSGKTTFLNVLSNYIPSDERIITIEDSAELQIRGIPNLVRLEVRNANVEGKNAVTIRDLLKSALRMRPRSYYFGRGQGCCCM